MDKVIGFFKANGRNYKPNETVTGLDPQVRESLITKGRIEAVEQTVAPEQAVAPAEPQAVVPPQEPATAPVESAIPEQTVAPETAVAPAQPTPDQIAKDMAGQ